MGPSAARDRPEDHQEGRRGGTGCERPDHVRAGAERQLVVFGVGRRGTCRPAGHGRLVMGETGRRRIDGRAMGTTLTLYGPSDGLEGAWRVVASTFRREERRFSRFRRDSELTAINDRAGRWTPISSGFAALLRFALERAAATEGVFDPTVLRAIEAAGYDRDFDEVLAAAGRIPRPTTPCGRWTEIEVRGRDVRLPSGVGLDLGGVAKGWTVDLAVRAALSTGIGWVLVSAGGDMGIGGLAPSLSIDVEDPDDPLTPLMTLHLDRGALATSSTTKRSWGPGLHHVIDARTGAPAVTDAVQVTTWAPTCAKAEVAATVGLLRGTVAAADAPSVIVGADGTVFRSIAPDRNGGSPGEEAA